MRAAFAIAGYTGGDFFASEPVVTWSGEDPGGGWVIASCTATASGAGVSATSVELIPSIFSTEKEKAFTLPMEISMFCARYRPWVLTTRLNSVVMDWE